MPNFSKSSKDHLATCHEDLQTLFNVVVAHSDCSIIGGHRGEREQNELFFTGKSQVRFPNSRHNQTPSMAIDVAPYMNSIDSIDWSDREQFHFFAGYVLATAEQLYQIGAMTRRVRWGGDWDRDMEVRDNNFDDLVHFELMPVLS